MLLACGSYHIYQRKIMMTQIIFMASRPVCPTFIHDDITRIFISIIGLLILSSIFYKILKYYNH